jgi:hypothetical protein
MRVPGATHDAWSAFWALVDEYCRKLDTGVGRPLAVIQAELNAFTTGVLEFRPSRLPS